MDILTPDARTPGASAGAAAPPPRDDAPQLRTLLLTDLCDSTMLVERLGDTPAAALFRAHDALVLRLQQQWRGRLIDRSDGLLLLFERPIDGLGFALDYARGLRDIGAERGHALQARAGLHVGEVLTWRNSAEAVSVGAKPLEVEGLAKPMAGRLMAMARPGQILLSAVAEPLTHRAAREFGQRGETLLWKSHGRWRFKGVPQAQEIFEVGEPGLAPLRAPASSQKAWRDIPMWRRPAALAAQAAVLGAVAVGTWFALRPQPAIAFGERDWVVVGDLRNLTGQPVLDESLEQAFRISLEQSRYVNVLSDLKARDTLARMRRPADTRLDRAIASEIALRDGARAVILPTVSEVGGRVRISAEVIDPKTQATVYSALADGRGAASVLSSVDSITQDLREDLGESLSAIEKTSQPLPQVSTANLDALRLYALAQEAMGRAQFDEAGALFDRALTLDPSFALAYIGQVRVKVATVDAPAAKQFLAQALRYRARLPYREATYLDAWSSEFSANGDASEGWRTLARLYPDYYAGHANYAFTQLMANRFGKAMRHAYLATAAQNPMRSVAWDYYARGAIASGQYKQAAEALTAADKLGNASSQRRRAELLASQGDLPEAVALLQTLIADNTVARLDLATVLLDKGEIDLAEKEASACVEHADSSILKHACMLSIASIKLARGDLAGASSLARSTRDAAMNAFRRDDSLERHQHAYAALSAAYLAQRAGSSDAAAPVLAQLELDQYAADARPDLAEMIAVVRAQSELGKGREREAVRALRSGIRPNGRFQAAVIRAHATNRRGASLQLQKLRGLAYTEIAGGQALQTLNVWDAGGGHRRKAGTAGIHTGS